MKPITLSHEILQTLREKFNNDDIPRQPKNIQTLLGKVFAMDCIDLLAMLPDESVDMIMTDEPYGITSSIIAFHSRKPMITDFTWDGDMPAHLILPWVYEAARVLKPGGVLLCCGISSWNTTFEDVCVDAGLDFKCNDVWIKTNPTTRMRHGGFRSAHEMVWIASKGPMSKRMKKSKQQELLNWTWEVECPECNTTFPAVYSQRYSLSDEEWTQRVWEPTFHSGPSKHHHHRAGHPTAKPDWLAARYLHMLSDESDIIVDPFAGEGTFPLMAKKMNRQFIANDSDEKWKDVIESKLSAFQESFVV